MLPNSAARECQQPANSTECLSQTCTCQCCQRVLQGASHSISQLQQEVFKKTLYMLAAIPVLGAKPSITRSKWSPDISPNPKTPCAALHFMSGGCRSIEPELYPRPDGTVYVCGEPAEVPVPDGGPAAVGLEQKSLQVLQVGRTTAEAVSMTDDFAQRLSITEPLACARISSNMHRQPQPQPHPSVYFIEPVVRIRLAGSHVRWGLGVA
jgi:hypothetical protein